MATVDYTFNFDSNAQGFVDGNTGGGTIAIGRLSTDSSSGTGGCIQATQVTKSVTQSEDWTQDSTLGGTPQTWEDMGVPAGSTITFVEVTAWQHKVAANTKLSSWTPYVAQFAGNSHTSGPILTPFPYTPSTTVGGWTAGTLGTGNSPATGTSASNSLVAFDVHFNITTSGGGGSANVDVRVDTITIRITYTPPAGGVDGQIDPMGVDGFFGI